MKKIFAVLALGLTISACGQKPTVTVTQYLSEYDGVSIDVARTVAFKKVGNCYKKVVTYAVSHHVDTDGPMIQHCDKQGSCFLELVAPTSPPAYTAPTIGEAVTKYQQAELKEPAQ